MKIIEFDPKYEQDIYDFVMNIKVNDLGWKRDAVELHNINEYYLSGNGNFWLALVANHVVNGEMTVAYRTKSDTPQARHEIHRRPATVH